MNGITEKSQGEDHMSNEEPASGEVSPSPTEVEIRQQASNRSWVCPGTGFASIGQASWAMISWCVTLSLLPATICLVVWPSAMALWTIVLVVFLSGVLWIAERIAIRRARLRRPSPKFLHERYSIVIAISAGTGILVIALFLTGFGSLRMAGTGMMPTLEPGERLVYHKHVDWDAVKPGAIIIWENTPQSGWGEPGWLITARILAGPGDELSIRNGRYLVNGETGPPVEPIRRAPVVLNIPRSPEALTIPPDCYFMVQDAPNNGFDSRVLSWAKAENIVGSRLWYLSSRGILKPVE